MASDDTAKKSRPMSKLWVLLFVLGTNVVTVFLFSGPLQYYYIPLQSPIYNSPLHVQYPLPSNDLITELTQTQRELLSIKTELKSSKQVSENLAAELTELIQFLRNPKSSNGGNADDPWLQWGEPNRVSLPKELKDFTAAKKLPLGRNPSFGSDTIYPPVGHACAVFKEDLNKYMDYKPGHRCPEDEILAQKLLLRGCEPLPRRRCHPATPSNYTEPFPFPESMWRTPPDSSVVWTAYSCKNYSCLIQRKYLKVFDDCKDCFDLQGREKTRWLNGVGSDIDYSIDEVLKIKRHTIRIGLDIGGGTGTFAVRMRERNVTIITTSMNFNGPFNNFIASRGVVPMYISVSQRLPFFDNTLDIVHSMHVLSNWIPTVLLEFILYDINRILRPGGVFWLDRFFCIEDQLKIYVPMIENVGFNKLKWSIGRKLDRGPALKEMYISALLEKPLNRH
jgi:SAM-dependent methyltransferase